jgi:hypothetical protein
MQGMPGYSRKDPNLRQGKRQDKVCPFPRTAGKLLPGTAGVETMKTILYDGSRQIPVDTRHDECLYAALRPAGNAADTQRVGKDLYLHTDRQKMTTYYLHLWSTTKMTKEKILPVSATTAERFLRGKGLVCNLFPRSDPISMLYQWGYGIAEEF